MVYCQINVINICIIYPLFKIQPLYYLVREYNNNTNNNNNNKFDRNKITQYNWQNNKIHMACQQVG